MGMATPALPRSEARKTPTTPGARRAAETSMERVRAAGHAEVVDELSGAGDEPRVLAAADASRVLGHVLFSPRLAADPLSPRLRALPFSSNCHACGISHALVSCRPRAVAQLELRAASRLEQH